MGLVGVTDVYTDGVVPEVGKETLRGLAARLGCLTETNPLCLISSGNNGLV